MSFYFDRYAYPIRLFEHPPHQSLELSIVIPCFNEPDIKSTLNSLRDCMPSFEVEVIIIINEAEDSPGDIVKANNKTEEEIEDWTNRNEFSFTLLTYRLIAQKKDAGVGLARKVGMDEACRRFNDVGNKYGIICCFDADSTCSTNYISTIHDAFRRNKSKPIGVSIHFEHPLPEDELLANGIIQYELHLRYYVNALRLIDYPFAHHTIGSSMAVRSDSYQRMGGMNKRKAGEDFYFLHRLMPFGKFIDVTQCTVYPSPRISNRVPFGTGKAMGIWQNETKTTYQTYNLDSFLDLGSLFAQKEHLYSTDSNQIKSISQALPESIQTYLNEINFSSALNRLNKQSSSLDGFIKNWFLYFDGFWVLKFIHFSRDHFYPNQPVLDESKRLANKLNNRNSDNYSAYEWLQFFRNLDRNSVNAD